MMFLNDPFEPWIMLITGALWAGLYLWRAGLREALGALVIGGMASLAWPLTLPGVMIWIVYQKNEALR